MLREGSMSMDASCRSTTRPSSPREVCRDLQGRYRIVVNRERGEDRQKWLSDRPFS